MTKREQQKQLTTEWTNFLSHPSVEHSLNVRMELTLKQRYATELSKKPTLEERFLLSEVRRTYRKRASAALPHLRKRSDSTTTPPSLRERFEQELRTRLPQVTPYAACVRQSRSSSPPAVNVPQRRLSLKDAPLFAASCYLSDDETRRIAVRIMNRLNRGLFGTAARRTDVPLRLTALICQHDKGTRRHLHLLLAVPPAIADSTFKKALASAIDEKKEPFIYRISRAPERIENLAASIRYNTDDFKTLSQNSILYIYTQAEPSQPENGEQPE